MSQIQRTVNHCEVCGHEWIPRPGVVSTHCTLKLCHSRLWNGSARQPKLSERKVERDEYSQN